MTKPYLLFSLLFFSSFSLLLAQNEESTKHYLLLLEFEHTLLNKKRVLHSKNLEHSLFLFQQKEKLKQEFQNFIRKYPDLLLTHEIRLKLAQYHENPTTTQSLIQQILSNGTTFQQERALLLAADKFPEQYLKNPNNFKTSSIKVVSQKEQDYLKLIYLRSCYQLQEYSLILREKQIENSTFYQELKALQILSYYGLGEQTQGKKQEKAFQKLFPQSNYFPYFQKKAIKHHLCNRIAPPLADTDLWGTPTSIKSYQNQIVVLLFWASWAPEGIQTFERFSAQRKKFNKKVFSLGISLDYHKEKIKKLLKSNPDFYWPHLFGGKGLQSEFALQYKIQQVPTFLIIDKQGYIRLICHKLEELVYHLQKTLPP